MKTLAKCERCGSEPKCVAVPSGRMTYHGKMINYYEVICDCGARTGRSTRKLEAYDDWNAKQECLRKSEEK